MRGRRGEVDKVIGADHFRLPRDLHHGLSFENKESLFQIWVDMGVSLTPVLNLPEDDFQAIRPAGSRTEEAVIGRSGMARRDICHEIFQMGDIPSHNEIPYLAFTGS